MEKGTLIEFLAKKNNDFFRQIIDKKNKAYLFDSQINTARKIVGKLGDNKERSNHIILTAKMQSGKTGVCNAVVNMINKSHLFKELAIFKYFFISGMNDCGLKEQTYKRVIEQIDDANIDNVYLGKRSKRNLSTNKYFVLKNSDLLSFDGNLDNSLIFVDEAHYGSNKNNVLTKFFEKKGIDWKNQKTLAERNIYIVSISATPFDEIISDKANVKELVTIDTDSNYRGVTEYLKSNCIFNADKEDFDNGSIYEYIEDAYERMHNDNMNGVIIIRTRKFDAINSHEEFIKKFNIFEMQSNGSHIEYARLNELMKELSEDNVNYRVNKMLGISKKPLLVLIKEAFRAGITINEEYKKMIYLIYDYSLKADTTAQALLGRMCGYRHDNKFPTHFYINKNLATQYSDWENDFENKNKIPADKMVYEFIDDNYNGNDVVFGSQSCGNIAIDLTNEEIIELYSLAKKNKNHSNIEKYLNMILARRKQSINYTYFGEIHLKGKNNYAKSSQEKRFNNFSPTSLVFQFRPDKLKQFMDDTNRDFLTREDLGKTCASFVLDAEINNSPNGIKIGGNKRLLIYHVKVGQKKLIPERKKQYKPHKDTNLI